MRIEKYIFKYSELNIQSEAMTLAMGYNNKPVPPHLYDDIDEVMLKGEQLCKIEGGYRIFDLIKFDNEEFKLIVENVPLDIHRIIFQQIRKSEKAAIFICTAGHKISDESKRFMNEGDLLKGYVYDTFGSIVVEAAMDLIQKELQNKMSVTGLNITNRYSPGYCDWNVSEQKYLFSLLPENFCGIELTDTCLMKPIKSVSGIIGIGKSVKFNQYMCNLCSMENCLYRNLSQRKNR